MRASPNQRIAKSKTLSILIWRSSLCQLNRTSNIHIAGRSIRVQHHKVGVIRDMTVAQSANAVEVVIDNWVAWLVKIHLGHKV
jgi:hypothetical protein